MAIVPKTNGRIAVGDDGNRPVHAESGGIAVGDDGNRPVYAGSGGLPSAPTMSWVARPGRRWQSSRIRRIGRIAVGDDGSSA
ncbi:MAG: hypothetical protein LBS10_09075, partial [Gracilibacteraceae bacterium]|nr:hypothetical protein [Gracilibacteraceae bacterium]